MNSYGRRRSGAWYLMPIFLSILGGLIAYFVLRGDDPSKAKNCLYLSLALVAAEIVVMAVFMSVVATLDPIL